MAKFVFVYHGGKMSDDPEVMAAAMEAWGAWFASMGEAVIDGGNPVGQSATVNGDGSISNDGGSNPASGYSLIDAQNMDDALAKAKSCPILANGGTVEVAPAIEMG